MTKKMKADLEAAGERIAEYRSSFICGAMIRICSERYSWAKTKEAKMIQPRRRKEDEAWWDTDEKGINARLLGIAMMTTMPPDMVDENL